jgi:hypothetical protein
MDFSVIIHGVIAFKELLEIIQVNCVIILKVVFINKIT